MNYYSTRNHQHIVSAAQAIACGLAPDGGLFVPESLPAVSAQQLQALEKDCECHRPSDGVQ